MAYEEPNESPKETSPSAVQDNVVLDSKTYIERRLTSQLKPHPRNETIYGIENIAELVDRIRGSQWVKPLVCTKDGIIISGHRRWLAAKELGLETLVVEIREFPDETAELEAILLENASRDKTTEQKVREAEAWKEIEVARAKLRMIATQNNEDGRAAKENFPGLLDVKGQARDAISERVGFGSGRTYEKATAVVKEIDTLTKEAPEAAMAFRKLLNETSVDAAHKLLKKPTPQRQQILSLIGKGEAKSAKEAEKMIKEDSSTRSNEPVSAVNNGASLVKQTSNIAQSDQFENAPLMREKEPEGIDWACKLIINRKQSTNSEQQNKILSAFVPLAYPAQLVRCVDEQQVEPFLLALLSRISPENLQLHNWTESQLKLMFQLLKRELDRRMNFGNEGLA